MGLLKSTSTLDLPAVRYEVKGQGIDLADTNRFVRKLMQSVGAKYAKQFAHLVHPETGERPDVIVAIADPSKPSAQIRISTDSTVMRDWLQSKGVAVDVPKTADAA